MKEEYRIAREKLERIKELDDDICILMERCREARRKIFWNSFSNRMTANYGIAGGGHHLPESGWMEINIKQYLNLSKWLSEKEAERDAIIDIIQLVKGYRKKLLYYRYVKGETWENVAAGINVSLRGVHREHIKALKEFCCIIKKREQCHK